MINSSTTEEGHLMTAEQEDSAATATSVCFFRDGKRRVDYVLVWEEDLSDTEPLPADEMEEDVRHRGYRQTFQSNLMRAGIEMETEITITSKKRIHFLKLFVGWEAMCYYAEYLRLRAPLKQFDTPLPVSQCAACLTGYNPMRLVVPNRPLRFYTCAFTAAKMQQFIGINQRDTYFTPTQRHRVAYEILSTRVYGEERKFEIGLERMIEVEIYSCAFPLHEGPHTLPEPDNNELGEESNAENSNLNPRQILHAYWASWGLWYKYQPLDHVRAYFGEKIAFYFAWLGLYTAWLLLATAVGIAVSIYGAISIVYDVPTNEVCNSGSKYKMCPICDEKDGCQFWHLSDICWKMKLSNLFDHPGTMVYAVFVSFWAVLFLEFWKRRNASLALRWGVENFRSEAARPRPAYAIACTKYREDPISGELEPHFPHKKRIPRIIVSTLCLIMMLLIVVAFILLTILFQTVISIYLFRMPIFRETAKLIANVTGALLHLVIMLIMEYLYERMAYNLTEWEMHKTECKFEDQFTMKVFIFEVCNYYSSIFYIGFLKGRFQGYPGNYATLFGFRPEQCDEGGCLFDLALSLGIIMIGRQTLGSIIQIVWPKLATKLHRSSKGLTRHHEGITFTPWESDYRMLPYEGLSIECMEMVLQFGFITIFVAAFPLAPLFALLNNWVEIRLDARKLVLRTRRPLAERAQGIGVWFQLLEIIAGVSVISNAFLIAFTSDILPKILYTFEYHGDLHGFVNFSLAWSPPNTTSEPCRYRDFRNPDGKFTMFYWKLLVVQLSFVIVFEHLVFAIRSLLVVLIPDAPKEVRIRMKRQNYLGRQALLEYSDLHRQLSTQARPLQRRLRNRTSLLSAGTGTDTQNV